MFFKVAVLFVSSAVFLAAQTAPRPGGTIDKLDLNSINDALDTILNDASLLEFTRIGVGVANFGDRDLLNPKWFVRNGNSDNSMPAFIYPEQTGLNLFKKNSISLSGTEGVITYDIEGSPMCLAVMWNVPNIGSNTMNIKIFPQMTPDRDVYDQMRDVAGEWGTGQWGNREEYGITVTGSITTGWNPKLIVYINSVGYNLSNGPFINAWCDRKLIGTDYCVRECNPIGKCDTEFRCSNDNDCVGSRLLCSSSCR